MPLEVVEVCEAGHDVQVAPGPFGVYGVEAAVAVVADHSGHRRRGNASLRLGGLALSAGWLWQLSQ